MSHDPFAAVLPPGRGRPGALEQHNPLADDEMERLTARSASADFHQALAELHRARRRSVIQTRRDHLIRRIASGMAGRFVDEQCGEVLALQRLLGVHPPREHRILSVGGVLHIWPLGDQYGHVALRRPEFLCGGSVGSDLCEHAARGAWKEALRYRDAPDEVCCACERERRVSVEHYPECTTPGPGDGSTPSELEVLRRVVETGLVEWLSVEDHHRDGQVAPTECQTVMWRALDSWTVDAASAAGDQALAAMLGDSYRRTAPELCSAFEAFGLADLMGDAYWGKVRQTLHGVRKSRLTAGSPALPPLLRATVSGRLRALADAAEPSRGVRLRALAQLS